MPPETLAVHVHVTFVRTREGPLTLTLSGVRVARRDEAERAAVGSPPHAAAPNRTRTDAAWNQRVMRASSRV